MLYLHFALTPHRSPDTSEATPLVFDVGTDPGKKALPPAIADAHSYTTALHGRCSRITNVEALACGATLLVNMRDIEPRKEHDGFDGAFLSP